MIYVDISAAVHGRAGLGRYAAALASALAAQRPEELALFYNGGKDSQVPSSILAAIPRHSVRWGYKPWRMAILLAHKTRLSLARLLPGATLFHSTEHLLMPLTGVPTVLTVHDLIYKIFPAYHKRLNYWYLNESMPLFCRRAGAIIAVSESTKRDIVNHYHIDPRKIHVVYEAAEPHFKPPSAAQIAAVRQSYNLPSRFLVHLGTIEPRKNLDRLLEAVLRLRQEMPDLALVLAGGKGWLYDSFFARIEAENLGHIVHSLGWVPDEDLPAVLAAADLGIQPSLYEGFGLPVLEQMASGQIENSTHSSFISFLAGVLPYGGPGRRTD